MLALDPRIDQDFLRGYIADRTESDVAHFANGQGAAVVRDGEMVGGVLFHGYRILDKGAVCDLSAAAEHAHCLTRGILREMFAYAFDTLAVTRLRAETAAHNSRCRSILKRLGFREEGVMRRAYDGNADSVVYSMLPEECRWLAGVEGA